MKNKLIMASMVTMIALFSASCAHQDMNTMADRNPANERDRDHGGNWGGGNDSPDGTWCGLAMNNNGGFNGSFLNGNPSPAMIPCQGVDVARGCPRGYAQFTFCYEPDHSHTCNGITTCVKH